MTDTRRPKVKLAPMNILIKGTAVAIKKALEGIEDDVSMYVLCAVAKWDTELLIEVRQIPLTNCSAFCLLKKVKNYRCHEIARVGGKCKLYVVQLLSLTTKCRKCTVCRFENLCTAGTDGRASGKGHQKEPGLRTGEREGRACGLKKV